MSKEKDRMPEEIERRVERCVAHVKNRFGFELDYTEATLTVLDHFVDEVVKEEAQGEVPPPGDRSRAQLMELMGPTLGAYFGEVMRRTFGGRWRGLSGGRDFALEFDGFFLRFNPAGAAAEVIMRQKVEDWDGSMATSPELTAPLHERLAAAPPLPEEQFYTFFAKHEVLQIAREYLEERAVKDGPVGCSAKDYDEVFGGD